MSDQQNARKDKSQDQSSSSASVPLKSGGEVVVTYHDSPPPSGKKSIHPRRRAPIVPTRGDRTGQQSADDTDSEKFASG